MWGRRFRLPEKQPGEFCHGLLAEKLTRMAGFRNILAHDCERPDYEIVHAVLHKRLVDVEEFSRLMARIVP